MILDTFPTVTFNQLAISGQKNGREFSSEKIKLRCIEK